MNNKVATLITVQEEIIGQEVKADGAKVTKARNKHFTVYFCNDFPNTLMSLQTNYRSTSTHPNTGKLIF